MVGAARERDWDQPSRRRGLRYRVQAPMDVTVLRSGIPDTLPGRSVNLGEGGVFAVLAGELLPGETVGVEILLPLAAEPLVQPPAHRHRSRAWIFLLSVAILPAGLWWRWHRGWRDLESNLQKNETLVEAQRPQVHVPAEVMEKLVTHRVDPEYPAAGRGAKLQGVIALDLVVGRDGSVVDIHALNGPDILAKAAMEALRWWRFEPYLVDGKPVVVNTTVAVEFKP